MTTTSIVKDMTTALRDHISTGETGESATTILVVTRSAAMIMSQSRVDTAPIATNVPIL
jgi:hypothetical protein